MHGRFIDCVQNIHWKAWKKNLWFFSNFAKWFLFENSYPSCWINKYYLNIQNGQMTQVIFPSWFEIFAEEQRTHPLVLLFVWHMTHLSMATLKLALKENGSVIRLPAYLYSSFAVSRRHLFEPYKIWISEGINKALKKVQFSDMASTIWLEASGKIM